MHMKNSTSVLHWWYQRVTAVIMIPLSIFFIYILLQNILIQKDHFIFEVILMKPLKAMFFLLFLFATFYHAVIGIEVICVDYIDCPIRKKIIILLVKLLSIVTLIGWIFAVFFSYQSIN